MASDRRKAFVARLAVVDPFGEALVPLNVCKLLPGATAETRAYEVSLALSRLFDSSMGFQMENILRHLILLLMESGLTLAEAPVVLEDEVLRGVLATRSQKAARVRLLPFWGKRRLDDLEPRRRTSGPWRGSSAGSLPAARSSACPPRRSAAPPPEASFRCPGPWRRQAARQEPEAALPQVSASIACQSPPSVVHGTSLLR
jgi:hypothetical protein